MDAKKLIELRKEAEKAVAEMPDGELKVKAFEVILNHLITTQPEPLKAPEKVMERGKATPKVAAIKSTSGRILLLKDEGFFRSPKSIGEVSEELKAHGWHYPLSTVGARLLELTQKRSLRRQKIKKGWKYTNP